MEFDAESKKMHCKYCNEFYVPELLDGPKMKIYSPAFEASIVDEVTNGVVAEDTAADDIMNNDSAADTMDVRIYSCGNCGGEIMTNDVEVSTRCAYCGQPTLMFERVSRERKPDKVIPFILTREQALNLAKEKFANAQCQGNSIKELQADSVHGIYMPYWKFGMAMNMEATVIVRNARGGTYHDREMLQKDIMLDGSKRFNDDIAFYLNPFDLNAAKPFNMAYLSGFYADRSDDSVELKRAEAKEKLAKLIKKTIWNRTPNVTKTSMIDTYDLNSIPGFGKLYEFKVDSMDCVAGHTEYFFLPVYFITFMIAGKKVIILVNGQTGKVIGNIPVIESEVRKKQLFHMIICASVLAMFGGFTMGYVNMLWGGLLVVLLGMSILLAGRAAHKKYKSRYAKTNSDNMFRLTRRNR